MEESGEMGWHGVAERAPHRDAGLIAGDVRTRIAGKDELLGGALALAAERTVAREDDFRVQPEVELHDPGDLLFRYVDRSRNMGDGIFERRTHVENRSGPERESRLAV